MLNAAGSQDQDFEKALKYAFLLLKYRPRSVKEMLFRLARKGYSEQSAQAAVSFLRNKNFLDDSVFARVWVQDKIARAYGPARIKRELSLKGIDPGIIKRVMEGLLQQGYSERETIFEVALRKLSLLKDTDKAKKRERLFAYLLRRGYSYEMTLSVLEKLESEKLLVTSAL